MTKELKEALDRELGAAFESCDAGTGGLVLGRTSKHSPRRERG